ncbi:MAG: 3'-5' exonuclease [Gemmatimonadaceae bacterium]
MNGVSLARPDSTLVARARDYLARGPATAVEVIGYVCKLPGPPEAVAVHLADVLLGSERGFVKEPGGTWMLTPTAEPIAPARKVEHVAKGRATRQSTQSATLSSPPTAAITASTSTPLSQLSYAVVDVETTGTRAGWGDRITEIAAVRVEGGEIVDVYETLINPERPIPAQITQLTRITSEMVRRAPLFAAVARRVAQALDGRIFVAHNATFDWRFVSTEFMRSTGEQLVGERVCTVRLTRALLPMLRRRSLDSLARYFGVEITARHRAGGDAVATAQVLIELLRLAEDRGVETLEDLRLLGRTGRKARRKRRALPHWMTRDESA